MLDSPLLGELSGQNRLRAMYDMDFELVVLYITNKLLK